MNVSALPHRFWVKVVKSDTCWLWTAHQSHNGYGLINWEGRPRRVHRLVAEHVLGLDVTGKQVDHLCHVRNCVRPQHLQLATQTTNQENRRGANSNSRSGIRGVSWSSVTGKWFVRICHNRRAHDGGYFTELTEAEAAAIAIRNEVMTNNLVDRRGSHAGEPERLQSERP